MRKCFALKKTGAMLVGFLMTISFQALGSEGKFTPLTLDLFQKPAIIKEATSIRDPKTLCHIMGYAFEPPAYTVSSGNLFTIQRKSPKSRQKYERDLKVYEDILQPLLSSYGDEVRLTPYHSFERYFAKGRGDLGNIIKYWQDFIVSYPIKGYESQKNKLGREIAYYSGEEGVNFDWLEGVIMRFAAYFSDPSLEERDVFSHVYPSEYEALLDKGSLSHNLLMRAAVEDSSNKHHAATFDVHSMLSYEGLRLPAIYDAPRLIAKHLHSYIRAPFPCYFVGTKIGIEDMMRFWLNDIYPIGFPTAGDQSGSAHGVKFSPLGFLIHDRFHLEEADAKKRAALTNFMLKQADIYVIDRQWEIEAFIEAHAPRAAERYYTVPRVLETLLDKVKGNKEGKFKPFLAGMFLATHEKNGFDASIFSGWKASNSASFIGRHIVTTLAANARKQLLSREAWENPTDLFQTSPITGRSLLTNAEIVSTVVDTSQLKGVRINLKKATVKRSRRFIDVTIPYTDRVNPFEFSEATLYHKQLNAADSLALLKYAGVRLTYAGALIPEGPRTSNKEAAEYISVIHKELLGLLDTFETIGVAYSDQLDS